MSHSKKCRNCGSIETANERIAVSQKPAIVRLINSEARIALVFLCIVWSLSGAWAQTISERSQRLADAMEYLDTGRGSQHEAIEKLRLVIEADPSDPHNARILYIIANLFAQGDDLGGVRDYDAGIEILQAITEKYPESDHMTVLAHFKIGDFYVATGRTLLARKTYERFFTQDFGIADTDKDYRWLEGLKRQAFFSFVDNSNEAELHAITSSDWGSLPEVYLSDPEVLARIDERAHQFRLQRVRSIDELLDSSIEVHDLAESRSTEASAADQRNTEGVLPQTTSPTTATRNSDLDKDSPKADIGKASEAIRDWSSGLLYIGAGLCLLLVAGGLLKRVKN